MKMAVVITTLNERHSIGELLAAIRAQTLAPAEVVVVDGGSTDGTWEELQNLAAEWSDLKVVQQPGVCIGGGRNRGVRECESPFIAVTDAGCRPRPHWLAELARMADEGAEVVSGVFLPRAETDLERAVMAQLTQPVSELDDSWNPSSRSMAFSRKAWSAVGGYPEGVPTGEDTKYCLNLRAAGFAFRLAPKAEVIWYTRSGYRSFFRQYHRYALGDGLLGTAFNFYGLKTLVYLVFLAGLAAFVGWLAGGSDLLLVPTWGALGLWLVYHTYFAAKMVRRGAARLVPAYAVLVMTSYDVAEISGFWRGIMTRKEAA